MVALQYYPGAQFSQGFVTNLGLELNVEQGISLTSQTPDKIQYPTTVHDYNGGVRVRIPLESLTPFLTVGYGDHAFKLGGAQRAQLVLPDVEYKYVRAVVGAQVPIASGVSLAASGGYRYVLSPGQIKTVYFPQLNVGGIEAKLYVGYALTSIDRGARRVRLPALLLHVPLEGHRHVHRRRRDRPDVRRVAVGRDHAGRV